MRSRTIIRCERVVFTGKLPEAQVYFTTKDTKATKVGIGNYSAPPLAASK
jgi:hypothetical protein